MSFITPQITKVDGTSITQGVKPKVPGTAVFEGNGFPGQPLRIEVTSPSLPSPIVQTVTVNATGEWKVTLNSLQTGDATIIVTELDGTPKTTSLTFAVQNLIAANLDDEAIRYTVAPPFITKSGIMFSHKNHTALNAEKHIMQSLEALHPNGFGAQITDADRKLKFGEKVYVCRANTPADWITQISSNGKNNLPTDFSKISFWYFASGSIMFDLFDGSKNIGNVNATQGVNQLVFNSLKITSMTITYTYNPQGGGIFVLGNLEIIPI